MPARMTAADWRLSATNALICGVGLLVVWLATAFAISLILGQSLRASWNGAGLIVLPLMPIWCLGAWFHGKNTAGPVVLDCGAHPFKKLLLSNAAMFLLMGIVAGFAPGKFGALFLIGVGIFFFILAFGRLQFRQNGIWQYWGLLRWKRLKSYHWRGATDCFLMLQVKSRLPLLGRSGVLVPMEHKNAVDELLKHHCSSGA